MDRNEWSWCIRATPPRSRTPTASKGLEDKRCFTDSQRGSQGATKESYRVVWAYAISMSMPLVCKASDTACKVFPKLYDYYWNKLKTRYPISSANIPPECVLFSFVHIHWMQAFWCSINMIPSFSLSGKGISGKESWHCGIRWQIIDLIKIQAIVCKEPATVPMNGMWCGRRCFIFGAVWSVSSKAREILHSNKAGGTVLGTVVHV